MLRYREIKCSLRFTSCRSLDSSYIYSRWGHVMPRAQSMSWLMRPYTQQETPPSTGQHEPTDGVLSSRPIAAVSLQIAAGSLQGLANGEPHRLFGENRTRSLRAVYRFGVGFHSCLKCVSRQISPSIPGREGGMFGCGAGSGGAVNCERRAAVALISRDGT